MFCISAPATLHLLCALCGSRLPWLPWRQDYVIRILADIISSIQTYRVEVVGIITTEKITE